MRLSANGSHTIPESFRVIFCPVKLLFVHIMGFSFAAYSSPDFTMGPGDFWPAQSRVWEIKTLENQRCIFRVCPSDCDMSNKREEGRFAISKQTAYENSSTGGIIGEVLPVPAMVGNSARSEVAEGEKGKSHTCQ